MSNISVVLIVLSLIVGFVTGWLVSERYIAFMTHIEHDFEELFKNNPHPELYNKDGELNRGEYMMITFEPGYDPEDFDPEDIIEGEG
jgi:hypothetical protein